MIFLSYSRLNKEAYELENELKEAGIPYERDISLVEGDPFWRQSIRSALEVSTMLVVVWSKEARQSPYIHQEIRAFRKEIIFVRLDETDIPVETARGIHPRQTVPTLRRLVQERVAPETDGLVQDLEAAQARQERIREECERLRRFIEQFGQTPRLEMPGGKMVNRIDGSEFKKAGNVWLAVDPITNAQYGRFMEATGYPPPPTWIRPDFSAPRLPVTGISWFEARAYAAWAGSALPDEAEWEAAARGDQDLIYATSTGELNPALAHFGCGLGEGAPCPVDAFPESPAGFRGLCGNTWDWCVDTWDDNHIIKGGGYMDAELFCQTTSRYRNFPIDRDCCVGFRLKIATEWL